MPKTPKPRCSYFKIVREERQYAAWLYGWLTLNWPNNLAEFVKRQ